MVGARPRHTLMVLRCAKCQVVVSREITEMRDTTQLSVTDGQPHLPEGFFRITTPDDDVVRGNHEFILNLRDLIHTAYHPDCRRSQGCCGRDGLDGMNIVCSNGQEIGTECSDCWMPHYAHIPKDRVETYAG
jgi:hypothetical protein